MVAEIVTQERGEPSAELFVFSRQGVGLLLKIYETNEFVVEGLALDVERGFDTEHTVEIRIGADEISLFSKEYRLSSDDTVVEKTFEFGENPPLAVRARELDKESGVWAGFIQNQRSDEDLTFRYEPLRTPDWWIVIVVVWAALCGANLLKDLLRSCHAEAEKACGQGKVKQVRSKKVWSLAGKCHMECEYKCV